MRAKTFEILRNVTCAHNRFTAMAKKPVRVATIIDEAALVDGGMILVHNKNVFFEDRVHDWDWSEKGFRYYSHAVAPGERADVLVVYELD